MRKQPRFEIVRTIAGWHSRFIASNGKKIWTTEVLTKRAHALRAISLIAEETPSDRGDGIEVSVPFHVAPGTGLLEVREVDER